MKIPWLRTTPAALACLLSAGCGSDSASQTPEDLDSANAAESSASTSASSGGTNPGEATNAASTRSSDSNTTGTANDDSSAASGGSSGGSSATDTAGAGGSNTASAGSTSDASSPTATSTSGSSDGTTYGDTFTGGEFHLGPVDWEQTEWHNSCSPYPSTIQQIEGEFLAGLELTHNGDGQLCDACVQIDAATGKSIVARVVTTGVTTENSIDLSPAAFEALDSGEYPRTMTWQVVKCPDTGNIYYQFQTEANAWWTSLWVRNARVPIAKVEVQSSNHASWYELSRGSDGTYTDGSGFGEGAFTLRVTGVDGQTVEDTLNGFSPGDLIESESNFE